MWLFFGLLLIFLVGIIVYFTIYLKNKRDEENRANESLIEDDLLLVDK
jgi:cbb3-type cytochrome oxidase subunit 3